MAQEGRVGEREASGRAEERHVTGRARERLRWKDAKAAGAEGGKGGERGGIEEERRVA